MNKVHSSVSVSSKAKIGENVTIAPHVIIEDDVEIGNDTYIGPFTVIYNGARIGNRVTIYQSASIAHVPQDLHYNNEQTFFYVGDDTVIHEFVTLHKGTQATKISSVGKNCYLMAYVHIGHDCKVGDNVILANAVQVGGHCVIEEYANIGGLTPVHQFCIVGAHSMTGGGFKIAQDLPPYILAGHHPLQYCGLNVIGLKRRGFNSEDIQILKKTYSYLYSKSLNVSQAREKIEDEFGDNKCVQKVLDFLSRSKRGLVGK